MKIIDVQSFPVYAEAKTAISGYLPYEEDLAKKVRKGYASCFVKVTTDEGETGFGEGLVREVPQATAQIIDKLLKGIVVGKDPMDVEVIWEEMFSPLKQGGILKAISWKLCQASI